MATATQVRRVMLQIQADDGDAEAKIERIKVKADELARLHPELEAKINTAAASAKLKVLRAEILGAIKPPPPVIPKVDDTRAKAAIDDITLRLDALGAKRVEPKVVPKLDKAAALTAGMQSGASTAQGMSSGITGSQYLIAGAVAAALALLPAIAASGGAIAGAAFGAALLIGTKKVQGPLYSSFHQLTKTLTSVMRISALPLLQPLEKAFTQIGAWARQLQPVLSRAFGSIGPLIAPMARGLESLVSGVLPGFIALMRGAAPAVSALASVLGSTGAGLGGLFKSLVPAMGPSSQLLREIGQTFAIIAPRVGLLSNVFATILSPALKLVNDLMTKLMPASDALIKPLTQVAQTLIGGVAAALTKVSGPLVQVATQLATQLGPVLPPIAAALAQVAQVAAGQLATSLTGMMPAITSLIGSLTTLLSKVIVPLLPSVLELGLDLTMLTNIAIPLAGPIIQVASVLVRLLDDAVIPLMPQIQNLTNSLAVMADGAVRAFQMVSSVLSLFGVAHRGGAEGTAHGGEAGTEGGGMAGEGHAAGAAAGAAYGSAWADGVTGGATAAAKKKAPAKVTAANLAKILAGIDLAGTAAQVKAAITKLIAAVTQDEKAGVITSSQGTALTLWLDADSTRLQGIATRRAKILTEIAQAQKYAASVATSIRQADNLQSAAAGGWNGGPQTTGQIIGNLQADVANIRKFAQNIGKLKKLGINSAYLDQLIQMGPEQGGQLAEQLAGSGLGAIRQINAAESQITQVSGYLGKVSANAMYDTGAMVGKGFLSGLESQQSALEKLMEKLADTMVNTLKHKLDMHSPSRVARSLTRDGWGGGLILGLEDSHAGVMTASARLARAMVPQHGAAGTGYGANGNVVRIEIDFKNASREIRTWAKKSIRITGGDVTVLGA